MKKSVRDSVVTAFLLLRERSAYKRGQAMFGDFKVGGKGLSVMVACAITVGTAGTALAQVPRQCKNLDVEHFVLKSDPNDTVFLDALVTNNEQYTLTGAFFSFHIVTEDNVVLGEASQGVGRLLSGETMPLQHMYVRWNVNYSPDERHLIKVANENCWFTR